MALLGLCAFFALGGPQHVTLQALAEHRAQFANLVQDRPIVSVLTLVVVYAALVAISFPGASLLTIFAGLMFGTWLGGVAAVAGATIGATMVFLIARSALAGALAHRAAPFLEKIRAGFHNDAFSYLLVLRLAPAFPFWLVNIAAGLLEAPLGVFVATTFFGIMPGTFVYAGIGAGAGAVLDAGHALELSGVLLKPAVIGPLLGLAALSLLPVILKRARSARDRTF